MENLIEEHLIGKYVIVRSDKAGVLFGILLAKNETQLLMKNMRKIWYYSGANSAEDIAINGLKNPDSSKVTVDVELCLVGEFVQVIPCTEKAVNNLKNIKIWSY